MKRLAVVALLAGCTSDEFIYAWDDRPVVCSIPIDDITKDAPWDLVETQLDTAEHSAVVALVHAHIPGVTISSAAIERILDGAEQHGLSFVTYRDLAAGTPPHPGLALAFDDQEIDAWFDIRETLLARNARVTFFLTRFDSRTPEQLDKLAILAGDGHDIEAHSVMHLPAIPYVDEHGLPAYVADEVVPSIEILQQAGYEPTVYAFPFGASTRELEAAVLEHVDRVRVGPGTCPN
ncbi:MAG TPA: polysaccharide deacetylase family protein [Kofleriaceae bacterium]|nr:polysaccharide deacetylase family protein [Kofleriaceae bacterium]